MKIYKYKILETLSRTIEIEAESEEKAWDKLEDIYYNADVVLTADDLENVEFYQIRPNEQ